MFNKNISYFFYVQAYSLLGEYMKKKIKIGIPRAFLYYRNYILWKNFFEKLNCHIVLSPESSKEILDIGTKYSIDESCLSSKIYLGHIASLIDKCDYVLVPRIENYGKTEKVCVKFNALYDIVKNLFPEQKILTYNIEKTKLKTEFIGFIKMGLIVNKNILKVIISYIISKIKEKKQEKINHITQERKLNNDKIKILIVSHPYNIYDKYISNNIIKYLDNNNIQIIYADKLDKKTAKEYSKELSNTLYWTYSKEIIGAVNYYKEIYDGIIFLTTFPCGVDSLVNELVLRKTTKPTLNIIIDSQTSEIGLETRLESFIDILKERKEND